MTRSLRACALLALAPGLLIAQRLPATLLPPAPPATAPRSVTYLDRTAASGLAGFRHVSGAPAKDYIIEAVGSGVAIVDADNDGLPDVYLLNGSTLDAVRTGAPAPPASLYRNRGNGVFEDVTKAWGVANERWGQGVCAGDMDNDGFTDLYVANFGVSRLYRNDGGKAFEDVGPRAGVALDGWATGCAFGDFDGDGWLDLFVAGYVTLDVAALPPAPTRPAAASPGGPGAPGPSQPGPTGMGASYARGIAVCTYRGEPVMCGPRGLAGAGDHLFRNNGNGTFTDVSREAGVSDPHGLYGLGVAWFDMDDDGRPDLIVANDSGPNHVYRNLGGGRFADVSYASGAALDGNGREQAHMGVAVGDYDNDGRSDIHITNFADDFNVLYRNEDGATFTDVSYRTAVASISIPFLGWGTDFLDYDNDGWLDLLVANGHVYPRADDLPWNTSYAQRALLLRNLEGRRFEDVGAAGGPGVTTPRVSRGSAVGDLDNDGDLDFVLNNLDGPPTLAINEGGAANGHWLLLQLRGDPGQGCPRDAIGSVVYVTAGGRRVKRDVASGRGQISQSDLRLHVGLGGATRVDRVEVRWANGKSVTYAIDRVDTLVTIDQRAGVSYR